MISDDAILLTLAYAIGTLHALMPLLLFRQLTKHRYYETNRTTQRPAPERAR